ncbi:MAG: hypothetical protein WCJ29_03560 [bacterium]
MNLIPSIILFASLLAISADIFLFAGLLNRGTAIISLIVAAALTWRLATSSTRGQSPSDQGQLPVVVIYLLSTIAFFKIILASTTVIAVRTPWTVLPREIFVAFTLMLCTAIALEFARSKFAESFSTFLTSFGYLALTLLIFPLGYGFDSFLHSAAELSIAANGSINPLPILYGGQYALVTALNFLTGISIDGLDRFLVPSLAAMILPVLIKKFTRSSLIALIFLPLSILTITTPFAFAALLFIAVVLICATGTRAERLRFALPIAIAACTIHLIAGIPALIIVGLSFLKHPKHLALASFGGALLVPGLMLAKIKLAGQPLDFHLPTDLISKTLAPLTTFRLYEDLAYLSGFALIAMFIFFTALGLRRKEKSETLTFLLASALAFALSGIMLSCFTFPDVIGYEQGDYGRRLLLLSVFALSPFMMMGLENFLERLANKSIALKLAALFAITVLGTGHFYLMYPRADRHETSKGFNVAAADLTVARMINTDAGTQPYFILAPQTTSAAFVHELGFPETIATSAGEILPYPIPTGGALYPYFLEMTYEPSEKAILDSMTLTGRNLCYFILPKFWWQYDYIKQKTAQFATGSFDIGDEITVFKFEK